LLSEVIVRQILNSVVALALAGHYLPYMPPLYYKLYLLLNGGGQEGWEEREKEIRGEGEGRKGWGEREGGVAGPGSWIVLGHLYTFWAMLPGNSPGYFPMGDIFLCGSQSSTEKW
jgi:hypothetical protein